MRFVDEDAVISGPHTLSSSILEVYHALKLDPAIIYLYSIMPYIDPGLTSARDFFQGGEFFNPLNEGHVKQGRDPRYLCPEGGYDDENGEYMYPWYTPLSGCANHSPCLVYDAQGERIWAVDQIDGNTTDPVYSKGWYWDVEEDKKEESNWGESDDGAWSGEEEEEEADEDSDYGSGGSSEFWSDDDDVAQDEVDAMVIDQEEEVDYDEGFEHVEEPEEWELQEAQRALIPNDNSMETLRSRPAIDVLRDINRWYCELKELPGQGEHDGWLAPKVLRPLYRKHGWPDNFDGRAFEIEVIFVAADESAHYDSEEPIRKVKCYESWLEYSGRDITESTQQIADADTPAAEWKARMKLWQAEERHRRTTKDLEKSQEKADRLCPGGTCQRDEDLPLWRLEKLRVQTKHKRESVERSSKMPDEFIGNPEKIRAWERTCRKDQESLELQEAAYKTAKADAERLCPGKTFHSATGIKGLGRKDTYYWIKTQKKLVEHYLEQIREAQEFEETVPVEAPDTQEAVKKLIAEHKKTLERCRTEQARYEKWLEEHGNETDDIVIDTQ